MKRSRWVLLASACVVIGILLLLTPITSCTSVYVLTGKGSSVDRSIESRRGIGIDSDRQGEEPKQDEEKRR